MPAGLSYMPLVLPASYREITRVEGTIPYPAGGNTTSNPLRIDQSGLLESLLLTFQGTLTTTATVPTLGNNSPYGIVKYVTLMTSGGVGRAINIPGYQLNVYERVREPDYADNPVQPVVASSANAWSFSVVVPVCVRHGTLYGGFSDYLGAIYAGDPEVSVQLTITWGNEASIITNQGAANAVLTGAFTVTSFKLDVPTPDRDPALLQAISWVHQMVEEQNIAVAASGPLALPSLPVYEPRVYLRIIDYLFNNGAFANGVVSLYDATIQDYVDFDQSLPEYVFLQRQLRRYVNPPPPGTYVLDFASGNTRQNWLPVQHVTLFKWTPTISNVALTNASLDRVSETVVPSPLAKKWIALTQARGNKAA